MAGTWINLMDAYVTEKNATGDWNQIGYTGPGVRANSDDYSTQNFQYTGTVNSWKAASKVKLNECTTGGEWPLTASVGAETAQGTTALKIAVGADGQGGLCQGLTPSFSTLADNYQ